MQQIYAERYANGKEMRFYYYHMKLLLCVLM